MACVENGLTVLFDRSPLFSLVVGHVGDGAHLSQTALCFSNPLLNSFRATRTPQQVSPHFRNTNPVPISAPVIQTLQSRARRCPRAPSLRSISHAKRRIRFARAIVAAAFLSARITPHSTTRCPLSTFCCTLPFSTNFSFRFSVRTSSKPRCASCCSRARIAGDLPPSLSSPLPPPPSRPLLPPTLSSPPAPSPTVSTRSKNLHQRLMLWANTQCATRRSRL